jgi:hypothetical protein
LVGAVLGSLLDFVSARAATVDSTSECSPRDLMAKSISSLDHKALRRRLSFLSALKRVEWHKEDRALRRPFLSESAKTGAHPF